ELSPFGYNETTAQEYFFLNEEQTTTHGYNWRESKKRNYQATKNSEDLPDSITQTSDSILAEIIACEHNGKCEEDCITAFKILPEDLKFYRSMNIPIPRLCSNCRRYQRLKQRNPLKLWHRSCMCDKKHSNHEGSCKVEFDTSFAPDRYEMVYCEKCYQQEVY
ncbi:MAG TPA: hypothetical protein VGO21_00895, partial [Candidatus Paceibacterota bacterium]|nr:hypothetical protein [Candidatus Paceibacterota bacterium]